MDSLFVLAPTTVHLWRIFLPDLAHTEEALLTLLSADEKLRASRFRFPKHRTRFVIARGMLRKILSLYLNKNPEDITFILGPHGKPYLKKNPLQVQFNVSHSGDFAVYALICHTEIGVDVQVIDDKYHDAVAKKFFSAEEYTALQNCSAEVQSAAFCQLWACKEAVIKVSGMGLYVSLGDFSIDLQTSVQWIEFTSENKLARYYLEMFSVHEDYRAAFATQQKVEKIYYWQWDAVGIHAGK